MASVVTAQRKAPSCRALLCLGAAGRGRAATLVALRILLGTGLGGECGLWCLYPELPGGKRSEAGTPAAEPHRSHAVLVSAQP